MLFRFSTVATMLDANKDSYVCCVCSTVEVVTEGQMPDAVACVGCLGEI